jgi:hypothetical protein
VADSPKVGLPSTGCIRAVHPDHGQRGDVYARGATAGVGGGSAAGWPWRTHRWGTHRARPEGRCVVQLVNQVTGKAGQGAKGAEYPPWAPIRLTQQLGLSSMVCGVPAGGWAS